MINVQVWRKTFVKDSSVSGQHNNIHTMAIEMYKVVTGMSPNIMNDISKQRDETPYNLRHVAQFLLDPIHNVFNGSELASYLGPKI